MHKIASGWLIFCGNRTTGQSLSLPSERAFFSGTVSFTSHKTWKAGPLATTPANQTCKTFSWYGCSIVYMYIPAEGDIPSLHSVQWMSGCFSLVTLFRIFGLFEKLQCEIEPNQTKINNVLVSNSPNPIKMSPPDFKAWKWCGIYPKLKSWKNTAVRSSLILCLTTLFFQRV